MFLPWLLLTVASSGGVGNEESQRRAAGRGRETEFLTCDRRIELGERMDAFVTLKVDRSHRPIERRVLFRTPAYWIGWNFPGEAFEPGRLPNEFGPVSVEIPSHTIFPVTAQIRFDERVVLTRHLARSNSATLYNYPASGRLEWKAGVSIRAERDEVPSPIGVSRIELVVWSRDGSEVARRSFPLPDWERLTRELHGAFAAVEAERRRRGCKAPIIVSGH